METYPKVFLDKNVVIAGSLGSKKNTKTSEFFNYLETYPSLGIITKDIEDSVERSLRVVARNFEHARENFYEMLGYLKVEKIDYDSFSKNLKRTESFFNELLKDRTTSFNINPSMVCSRFSRLVKKIHSEYSESVVWNPEFEDKVVFAQVLSLQEKYNPLFLASKDEHFSGTLVSKAIEDTFKIKCDTPAEILPEIKKYEHLLKSKYSS